MSKPTQPSPTLSLVDRLEAKFRIREEFFEVKLPGGDVIKFRNIRTLTERKELQRALASFGDLLESGKSVPPTWKPYLPIDRDVAESLAVISHLSVEPKLSHFDVIRLHGMPEIADIISFEIQAAWVRGNELADVEEIETEKKD